VSVLVAAAGIAGLVLGGAVRGEPPRPAKPHPPTTIAAAGVRLELPSGWARSGPTALAGFDHPLWLGNSRADAHAAVELSPAASPTLLPVGLHASGGPATVQLGRGKQAWRYRLLRPDGVPVVLYAIPTTKGIETVGCLGVSGQAAERACSTVASAVTVPGARRLEPGPRAAFFSRLPVTVASLGAARAGGVRALDAATRAAGQALAADRLARAHRAAAADLARVSSSSDSIAADTVAALGATAGAYTALANAARARAPRRYAAAGSAVSQADRRLRRTMAKVSTAVDAASDGAASSTIPLPTTAPAMTSTSMPAANPRSRPALPASNKPSNEPATKSVSKAVTDAETKSVAVAKPSPGGSSGADLTVELLLLFAAVACFLGLWAVRQSLR
jgi:hypothetical protein